MKEPKFRCPTSAAIQILVREFDYPYNEHIQDWEYEVAKCSDIEKYFAKYTSVNDDDIRFLLMEMIIETSNENRNFDWIAEVWPRVKQLLTENFALHEYTVYYWSCFDNDNIDEAFYISSSMRSLWDGLAGRYS